MTERPARPANRSRMPFFIVVALLVLVGAVLYYNASSQLKTKRVNLALITWNEDPFWGPVIDGAKDAAEEFNVALTVVQSKPDVESQNKHIRDVLAKKIQGIAISPNDPKAQQEIFREVAAQCPIVTFDIDSPDLQRRVFVGIDNYSAGHFAADQVREALPEGGEVIIAVGSIDMLHGRDRRQGVVDGLLDRPYQPGANNDPLDATLRGSKYSVVSTVIDHGDPAQATSLLVEALKAHPQAKCVVGLFSYNAGAALAAIDQVGRKGQVKVVAFDETEATQAGILDGTIHSSILQDQYRIGAEAVRLLAHEVRTPEEKGPSGPRMVQVEIQIMDRENIQSLRESRSIRTPASPTSQPAQ